MISHNVERYRSLCGDLSLEVHFHPDLLKNPTTSFYEIHFNTTHKTDQKIKKSSFGLLNHMASEAGKGPIYYQMGAILINAGPGNSTIMEYQGFDNPQYANHKTIVEDILQQLTRDGFIKAQQEKESIRTPANVTGLVFIAIGVIELLLAITSNIAASHIPEAIKPFLRWSWPVFVGLGAVWLYLKRKVA
jgi:hypothetical protein